MVVEGSSQSIKLGSQALEQSQFEGFPGTVLKRGAEKRFPDVVPPIT